MSVSITPYVNPVPSGTFLQQPDSQFTTNRDGTCTLVETYRGNIGDLVGSSLIVTGGTNPNFGALQVWSSKITYGPGGIGTLVVESRGALNGFPAPEYTLDRATHNEPLSTHPKWVSDIAGTPSTPLNGAIFVDPITGATSTASNAVFKGWTTGSIFEGVEDYLAAGSTFTISYAASSPPDISGVGQIVDGGPDNAPDTPSGFFWIYTGASYTQHGNVYRNQETYLLTDGVGSAATTILYGS